MSTSKLLGKALPGKSTLTIGGIEAYLLALRDCKDPKAVDTLTNIGLSILERFGKALAIAEELSKTENAHKDPVAMGVANGMIMALNYMNDTVASEKHLVELPVGGFTQYNPMVIKTRPAKYYVHKKGGGRYHLMALPRGIDGQHGDLDYAVYKNIKTEEVHVRSKEDFKEQFEERNL